MPPAYPAHLRHLRPLRPPRPLHLLAALPLLLSLGALAAPADHHTQNERRPKHANPPHTRPTPKHMAPHSRGQGMPGPRMEMGTPGAVQFSMAQHHEAMVYFAEPEHQGFVPPGLAKKGGVPPGQLRKWQRGQVLPAGVVYYALPRSLELVLGPPPAGHRYVRVATDILLLAIGTGIVVDALEGLVR